jgi:signal transduction histidine kinase
MHSLRNRLTLVFFAITLTAVAGIYLYVVPPLESRLRAEKLRGLTADTRAYSADLIRAIGGDVDAPGVDRLVRQAADGAGARVTLYGVSGDAEGLRLFPISDSTAGVDLQGIGQAAALRAARAGATRTGTEPLGSGRVGEAARPLVFNGKVARVVVFSEPLRDVTRNVALIRRQIVIAGVAALLFAVVAGWIVASALTRRVKRIEQAAEQVAAGDFSQQVPVDSVDELGQLAAAFNEMQRQLAQLEGARRRFIATASHELRTPIFSLGGFVELLEDEDLDEATRRQFLGQVHEQVQRLQALTADLLDLSRLESGSLELRAEPTDVGALAQDVTGEFAPVLAQHGSTLDLDLAAGPVMAVCDPDRVAQIVRILVDNAIGHTPPGTAIAVHVAPENGHARLDVRDGGLGIKRDNLPRVFEPFFTSDDRQGAGLGLAIARELAEQMDGHLGVQSVPGRTTFTLALPGDTGRSVSSAR